MANNSFVVSVSGEEVTYCKLVKHARFSMAAAGAALCYFQLTFWEPILAMRLTDFKLGPRAIGAAFVVMPLCYIPVALAAACVPSWIERRVLTIVSALGCVGAFLCAGPSQLLGFPDQLWLLIVGQALIGLFTPAGLCVGLSEMVASVERVYPGQSRRVKNLSSGFFNAALGVGQILAPLYGTIAMERVGFRWTNDIVALATLAFALLYLYVGGGWKAFGQSRRNRVNEQTQQQALEDGAEFRLFGADAELGNMGAGEMRDFAQD